MANRLSVRGPVEPGFVRAQARLAGREGFVMPAVIFSLLLMSALAVAALLTAQDEYLSSRALRESVGAMYAAEAGLNEVWATWDDSLVANLNPGDSLDLGWTALPYGSSYRAVIHRFDNGGQKMYGLVAEGRGAGALGGQRVLTLALSNTGAVLVCCTAAARGGVGGEDIRLDSADLGGVVMSGEDMIPVQWDSGECTDPLQDIPGVVWGDTNDVRLEHGAIVNGTPPLAEDTSINGTNLFEWGGMNYDDLVAIANITFPDGPDIDGLGHSEVGGVCDTSDPLNWGAPETPSSDCFTYFPIIHVAGDLRLDNPGGPNQGILLVDGELRIEQNFVFYGIIIAKDEIRLEKNVEIYGGVIAGGRLRVEDGATIQYSQCAANRAMELSGVSGGVELLSARSWGEVLR